MHDAYPAPDFSRFDVDPDITVVRTPDKAFYLDEAMFVVARERFFARSWHGLGPLGGCGQIRLAGAA